MNNLTQTQKRKRRGSGWCCAAGAAAYELCARGRCRHFDGWKWSNVTKPSLLGLGSAQHPDYSSRPLVPPTPRHPPNRTGAKVFWQRIWIFCFFLSSAGAAGQHTDEKLKTDFGPQLAAHGKSAVARTKSFLCFFYYFFTLQRRESVSPGQFYYRPGYKSLREALHVTWDSRALRKCNFIIAMRGCWAPIFYVVCFQTKLVFFLD